MIVGIKNSLVDIQYKHSNLPELFPFCSCAKHNIFLLHTKCTVPKIRFMYFQKWNYLSSFPIPAFMYLRAIYIFPGLVCLFSCSKIGRLILRNWKIAHRYMNVGTEHYEAAQLHFWEYINRNQTFILDSHRPFIWSVLLEITHLFCYDSDVSGKILDTVFDKKLEFFT